MSHVFASYLGNRGRHIGNRQIELGGRNGIINKYIAFPLFLNKNKILFKIKESIAVLCSHSASKSDVVTIAKLAHSNFSFVIQTNIYIYYL